MNRRTMLALFVGPLVAGLALLGTEACAQNGRSGPELLAVAERSFSDIPFGTQEGAPGLTMVVGGQCEKWADCSYIDANDVGHAFWEGELVVKTFLFPNDNDQPTTALGIGTARAMDDVVTRVTRFLPEADLDCRLESDGGHTCGATLGEGWITLRFGRNGRVREARIDAYHFT
ncbi:hypothetical protein [Brevundimonas halotolerans]|uniref:Uncharacterized protein n=1 Tax=Brevundimonas halotolerans TaxID=69670 RepID=A0A7W9E6K7_9CAUL|nr:hypothetical protein [Brevundimonas halotolerans]MBB5660053.1 hypothetical protein [Brevundimonas halotolerans]